MLKNAFVTALVALTLSTGQLARATGPTASDGECSGLIAECVQVIDKYKLVVQEQDALILKIRQANVELTKLAYDGPNGTPWYYRGLLSASVGALGGVALKKDESGAASGALLGLSLWLLTEALR